MARIYIILMWNAPFSVEVGMTARIFCGNRFLGGALMRHLATKEKYIARRVVMGSPCS